MTLLNIKNLSLNIGKTPILEGVNLSIEKGTIMGLVGESGSGKSMIAYSVLQLLPNATSTNGEILYDDANLLETSEEKMCALRGDDISMVFQEPMTALNPLQTIGAQIVEGIRLHTSARQSEAENSAREILDRVGLTHIPLGRYPHELSGGQRQRVVIAIACTMRPRLLIADEPTTALDVTVQAQILDLMRKLVKELDMGLLLISHDLGVVAEMADEITILRQGKVVEQGKTIDVLKAMNHPYTRKLAEASCHVPTKTKPPVLQSNQTDSKPLISITELSCIYPGSRLGLFKRAPDTQAVDKVSFDILSGQTLGLVGESGCGKSTLANTLLGLNKAESGAITFDGEVVDFANQANVKRLRRNSQMVFQDPYGSFNPRHRVLRLVSEPLHLEENITAAQKKERVEQSLLSVGLNGDDMHRFAHEFSGGQRQRIAIARALITNPKLIIADEPVSALDVSIRAQILDLFVELRERLDLACLFISHDLSVVRAICDEVIVMQKGKILEYAETEQLFDSPKSDYTKTLINASPDLAKAIANKI